MSYRFARGVMLVELLVATVTLVAMAAGAGLVFTHTTRAVGLTRARVEVNASLRAASALIRSDLRALTGDGVLIVAEPIPGPGYRPRPLLMMTVAGRFVSRTETSPPVTANAALVVYTLADDATDPSGEASILCRYAYLLAGDGRSPRDLAALVAGADPTDPNPFDATDVLGDAPGDLASLALLGSGAGRSFEDDYMRPLLAHHGSLNTRPSRMDDEAAGGVAQLWAYVVGGCAGLDVAFHDGLDENAAPLTEARTVWFTPASDGAGRREEADGTVRRKVRFHSYWMTWTAADRGRWPKALRLRLHVRDARRRLAPTPAEIIVPAPG